MSLKGLFKKEVITCTADYLVTEAASMMRDKHVGDIVVIREDADKKLPIGLITDRDIAIGCVASAADRIADVSVEEIMSKNVVCANENEGLYEVVQKMRKAGVARMPVVDKNGDLLGIISASNILALLNDELSEIVSISDAHKEAAQQAKIMGGQPAERLNVTGPQGMQ